MALDSTPRLIELSLTQDLRGDFLKVFPFNTSEKSELNFSVAEIFSTMNRNNGTVRGMHYQGGSQASRKIVWIESGEILDVCINIQKGPEQGKILEFNLQSRTGTALYVPTGWAHGYQTLVDNTLVCYLMDKKYDPTHDLGINSQIPGFKWPLPVSKISKRDIALPKLDAGANID
jgi:dTDP-4-dehydrorhamnose 3,5-epimerase